MKVLIVGDSPGTLVATRELGRAGWTVGIGSESRLGLAAMSRWASHWHRVPSPLGELSGFVDAIQVAAAEKEYELVFGGTDAHVLALSAKRQRLAPRFPYTAHECLLRGFDKLHLVEGARRAGLSAPVTLPANRESIEAFEFPLVVKSRLHWTPGKLNQALRVQAVVAHGPELALEHAALMKSIGAEPLFQEYVAGEVLHFIMVTDHAHRIVSRSLHRTTHLGSSLSGQSARLQAIAPDDSLTEQAQAFLTELRWFGLVDLQFRVPAGRPPQLTDFNGRMSAVLANACGMRAMDTWARFATGRNVTPSQTSVVSRYQALEGDLRRAVTSSDTGRVRDVLGCFVHAFRAVHPILSRSDPLPVLAYLVRLATRIWRKKSKKIRAHTAS